MRRSQKSRGASCGRRQGQSEWGEGLRESVTSVCESVMNVALAVCWKGHLKEEEELAVAG